jgi:hypothetical protein
LQRLREFENPRGTLTDQRRGVVELRQQVVEDEAVIRSESTDD